MSKIYHFNEIEDFFGEEEWKMQIDVTDIWNQYSEKKIDFVEFNTGYKNRLVEYKEEITNLGDDVWNNLVALINKMTEKKEHEELISVYDDIYNWADQNDVLIKTK